MELATTLKSETVQNRIREVGINPNYWYPMEWADQIKPGQIKPVEVWQQAIALYRDTSGHLHALEDACPHRGVALHKGKIHGSRLACPYHGWEFDGKGHCVNIPYVPADQKLPCATARSYPVREKYGLIWLFPGNPHLADTTQLPHVPEYEQQDQWLLVRVTAHFRAHFSVCNENAMDVFHGFLHQDLQGWFDPVLMNLKTTQDSVQAEYNVSYKGRLAKFLGLSERANEVTTLPIAVRYRYPHFTSAMPGVSALYLMRLPVGPAESRSFALFFFKVRLPKWLLGPIKPILSPIIERFMLNRFLAQDIEMMESEQQTYQRNPSRRCIEINPAIIALQRVIIRQYEQFVQQSSQSSGASQRSSHDDFSDKTTGVTSVPGSPTMAFSQRNET